MCYLCRLCGFLYDEETRGPIPPDYVCPICGASRDQFEEDS